MRNVIIPYNPKLKLLARQLRKQGIVSEILLWKRIKGCAMGVEFHRQVPMLEYIVDFYCHELMLAIEIDGLTHDFDEAGIHDAARQQAIESYGVSFLRFTDKSIKQDMQGVLRAIEAKVEELILLRNPS